MIAALPPRLNRTRRPSGMRRPARFCLVGLCVLGLAGCGFPPPESAADRGLLASCRADADRVYDVQNRAQLSERDGRDTPFSGSGQAASPSDGLADQYSHARMVDSCVRHNEVERPVRSP